jgi:hypothetical protein
MIPVTKNVLDNGVLVAKPLYILRRVSDKFVINSRALSNTTGLPNPGEDQEYLPILIESPAPDHDQTFTVRTTVEGPNEALKQQEIKYVVTDKPKEERLAAAENAERLEVARFVATNNSPRDVTLLLAALFRAQKGLELTPDETAAAEKIVATAAVLTKNLANLESLKAAIEAGQKPDLSAGWEPAAAPATP